MFTVYVLYSPSFDKAYKGWSSNFDARFLSHNQLATKGYTRKYRPWEILFTEECATKQEAIKREAFLKSGKGRAFIREFIKQKYGAAGSAGG